MSEYDRFLEGYTIACLESRRGTDVARMIERAGGRVYVAPTLRELPLEDEGPIRDWLQLLTDDRFAVVIFLTGVGCRLLLECAERNGLLAAALTSLGRTRVAARGPKPVNVLKQHGVRIDVVAAEPNTSEELLAGIDSWDLAGKTIGLQVYGGTTPYLTYLRTELARRDARIVEIAPYRWGGPVDERPVRELIDLCLAEQVDALAVFSSSQIHHLFEVAEEHGQDKRLREALNQPRVLVAAVGPVTAQAIEEHGVKVDVTPEHPRMGHLLKAMGEALALRRRSGDC